MITKYEWMSNLGETMYSKTLRHKISFCEEEKIITFFGLPEEYSIFPHQWTDDPQYESKTTTYNFISPSKKVVIKDKGSIFHLFAEILPTMVDVLCNYPNVEIIFYIGDNVHPGEKDGKTLSFLKQIVSHLNSMYRDRIKIILKDGNTSIRINNFVMVDVFKYLPEPKMVKRFSSILLDLVGGSKNPSKKIYLSRESIGGIEYDADIIGNNLKDNTRINNEKKLEDFFRNNGFEIIVPERIDTMIEQQKILSEAKMLVSATSSGLGSAIVMQPGGVIVELCTTFDMPITHNGKKYMERIFHNQYGPYAYLLELDYVRIPNTDRDADTIIDRINRSDFLKKLLGIEVEK